jgi:hypothetical protein
MTTTELHPNGSWLDGQLQPAEPPRRRLRGLRMPVLPTGAWLAQVGGGIGSLLGVYLQFGVAVTLITGGVAALVLGALREAGKV